jgi:hypothetical protein
VGADGVAQGLAQLGRQGGLVLAAHVVRGHGGRAGEALDPGGPALAHQQVAGRELARGAEDGQRRRDRVEGQEGLERLGVDGRVEAGGQAQGVELGGEGQRAAGLGVEQRLDAEAVAGEHEPALGRVPQREGEHAAQALDEARPPLQVGVGQHLGVRARAQPVTGGRELGVQRLVVVDLAVLDHGHPAVGGADGLVAVLEVDDRQPPGGEPDRPVGPGAGAVGAAVEHLRVHRLEPVGVDGTGAVERQQAADAAHLSLR